MVLSTARVLKPLTAAASHHSISSASSASFSSSAAASSSSTYTIRATAAFARALLRFGCSSVTVRGLDRFLSLLHSPERLGASRGLLTYCNHISVLDEPTIWGTLPASTFKQSRTVRWTLGASDIMFTNKYLSQFFRNGQCIETVRGGGIHQKAIDQSIEKLSEGNWIHLFPEGYVNVSTSTKLRRFKWGIARMLLEAQPLPEVVPIYITGFDKLMPEPRDKPKWLPRFGQHVTIDFGAPITPSLAPIIDAIRSTSDLPPQHLLPQSLRFTPEALANANPDNHRRDQADRSIPNQVATEWNSDVLLRSHSPHSDDGRMALARSQLAALLRHHLALVGVSQRNADGYANPQEEAKLAHTESLRAAHQHATNNVESDGERKNVGV